MSKTANKARQPKAISDEEVARFLKQISISYRDKRTGNPLLAEALLRVAGKLLDGIFSSENIRQETKVGGDDSQITIEGIDLPLEEMNTEDVDRFVADESKTKAHLIALAGARFGIPRSALLPLTADRVRAALRSALQHETSIAVIGAEASRYGARRKS